MIYPAFQKAQITDNVDFLCKKAEINGFDCDYAETFLSEKAPFDCKGDMLYIDIIKKNSRETEYITESGKLTDEKYFMTAEKCDNALKLTLTVSGRNSLFRALCRVVAMLKDKKLFIGEVEDYPLFVKRGYIEGFYGTPWSHKNRK